MRYVTNLTHSGFEPRYSPYYTRTIKEDIPMQTITRAALIQCIEAGIHRARTRGGLLPFQQARLRLVAITAKQFTVGNFRDDRPECGCPLTQAGMGIGSEFECDLVGQSPLTAFYEGFDALAREVVGRTGGSPVSVVE